MIYNDAKWVFASAEWNPVFTGKSKKHTLCMETEHPSLNEKGRAVTDPESISQPLGKFHDGIQSPATGKRYLFVVGSEDGKVAATHARSNPDTIWSGVVSASGNNAREAIISQREGTLSTRTISSEGRSL